MLLQRCSSKKIFRRAADVLRQQSLVGILTEILHNFYCEFQYCSSRQLLLHHCQCFQGLFSLIIINIMDDSYQVDTGLLQAVYSYNSFCQAILLGVMPHISSITCVFFAFVGLRLRILLPT